MFGPKKEEVAGGWRRLYNIMRSFVTYTLHQILLGWSSQGECHGQGM